MQPVDEHSIRGKNDGPVFVDFLGGKDSAINGFKGPVMKASRGQANPKLVDETLRRLLGEMK